MNQALQPVNGGVMAHPALERQVEAISRVLQQSTPREAIRWRPGKGGRQLAYTDHVYVTRTLNEAFGWRWSFEVDHEQVHEVNGKIFEATCRGKLTVWLPGVGEPVVKMQMGCQPIEMLKDGITPVSIGDAMKGSASDALKKCASQLGIALDLYDSDHDPRKNPTSGEQRASANGSQLHETDPKRIAFEMQRPGTALEKSDRREIRRQLGQIMMALRDELGVNVDDLQATMLDATGRRSRDELTDEQAGKLLTIYQEIANGLRAKRQSSPAAALSDEDEIPF